MKAHIFPLIESYEITIEDVLRTVVEHVAIQIANQVQGDKKSTVLVTGGGTYNTFLIQRLMHYSQAKIHIPSSPNY